MEVAGDGRAALAWAILRRETFMSRTNEPPAGLDMRMITNRIRADVVDLRGAPHDTDQAGRWEIGRHYYDRSAAGILFWHPEILGAEFLSVFSIPPPLPPKASRRRTTASGGMEAKSR